MDATRRVLQFRVGFVDSRAATTSTRSRRAASSRSERRDVINYMKLCDARDHSPTPT